MKSALGLLSIALIAASGLLPAQPPSPPALKPDPIVGEWRYFNNHIVTITADGRLASPKAAGTWEFTNNKELERKYKLTWQGGLFVDTLVLSRDGNRLAGKNQKGERVSAARVAP